MHNENCALKYKIYTNQNIELTHRIDAKYYSFLSILSIICITFFIITYFVIFVYDNII